MPKYQSSMGIRNPYPDLSDQALTQDMVDASEGNSFTRGLRSGVTTAGGQLHAVAGRAGETLGANDFAANQYAQSQAAQEQAAREAPTINSLDQVHGIRDAGSYIAGQAGSMLPVMGAVGGAALTAPLWAPASLPAVGAGVLAGTIAGAPFNVGQSIQRTQNDPTMAKASLLRRNIGDVGGGIASSAVQSALPAITGMRLFGKAAGEAGEHAIASAAARRLTAAKDLGESVIGQGAVGGTTAAIDQASGSFIDPHRDTSHDADEIAAATKAGAAMGVPFGLASGVAALHDQHGDILPPPKNDHTKTNEFFNQEKQPFDISKPVAEPAEHIASGEPPVKQYAEHLGDDPDLNNIIDQHAEDNRVAQTSDMKEGILNDPTMSEEDKAKVADADPTDRTGQMKIGAVQMAREKIAMGIDAIDQAHDSISKTFNAAFSGETNSEAGEGIKGVVHDVVMPFLWENRPDLMNMPTRSAERLGDSLRKLAATMSTGKIDPVAVDHLRTVFGDEKLREVIGRVGDATGAETPEFMNSLAKIKDDYDDQKHLSGVVNNALGGNTSRFSNGDIDTITKGIRAHMNETAYTRMGAAERATAKANFEEGMKKLFGDKTEGILEEFAKRNEPVDVHSSGIDEKAPENEEPPTGQTELEDTTSYHGSGRDMKPEYMDSTEDHLAKGFPAPAPIDSTVERVSRAHPNKIVDKVNFEDLPPDVQAKYPGGEGKQIVQASGTRQEGDITHDDMGRVRVDTAQTSHRNNKESHITAGGVTVDAKRLLVEGNRPMVDGKPNPWYVERSTGHETGAARSADVIKQNLAKIEALTGKKTVINPDTVIDHTGRKWKDVENAHTIEQGSGEFENKYEGLTAQQLDTKEGQMQDEANRLARMMKMQPGNLKLKGGYERLLREIDAVSKQRELVDKGTAADRQLEPSGRSDADPFGQIHDAENVHGDEGLAMKEDFSQQPLKPAIPERGPTALREKIDSKMDKLENFHDPVAELKTKQEATRPGSPAYAKLQKQIDMIEANTPLAHDLHDKITQLLGMLAPDDRTQDLSGTMRRDRAQLLKAITEAKGLKELQSTVDPMFKAYERDLTGDRFEAGNVDTSAGEKPVRTGMLDEKPKSVEAVNQTAAKQVGDMTDKELGIHRALLDKRIAEVAPKSPEAATLQEAKNRADDEHTSRMVDKLVDAVTAPKAAETLAKGDAATVEKVVNKLNKKNDTKAVQEVNTKVTDQLAKDDHGEVAYSAMKGGKLEVPEDVQKQVKDYISKVLGPDVVTRFAKMFHEGAYQRITDAMTGKVTDLIKLSMHSMDPMGTAFHESLHAFMQHMKEHDTEGVNKVLWNAASSRDVIEQLNNLLKDHPAALEQIENSPEERAAYMYQFYRSGDLKLGVAPRGIMQKIGDFIKKTLGVWTNDERAMHIMDYLHEGNYAKDMASGVNLHEVLNQKLMEQGQNKFYNRVADIVRPIKRVTDSLTGSGDAVLRDLNNGGINKVLDKVLSRGYEKNDDHGYIPAAREEKAAIMNKFADKIGELKATDEHMGEALHALQTQTEPKSDVAKEIVKHVRGILDDIDDYSKKAGVDYGDRFKGTFFPGVWDGNYIASNQKEFMDMMSKYVHEGKYHGDPTTLMHNLIANDGNEFGIDDNAHQASRPGFMSGKKRHLDFISPEDRARFSNKDLFGTMNNYITQATKRAEWTRRFGDENETLNDHIKEARQLGATEQDIQDLNTYLDGIKGTRGADINPSLRKLNSGMMVYQNLVKLPLAVFSLAADPLGIAVRSGHIADAFHAMKRGLMETRKNFTDVKDDEWTQIAKNVGTIDHASLVHALGSAFSGGMMGDFATKVNNTFFKYNLVEQMNTSMRTSATQSAFGFLARHADGTGKNSTRWLGELGLKPNEVIIKDGRPLYTKEEFMAHGMKEQEAIDASLKMRGAINKYVDGAVLRPNAAHKPGWMNDPHYAVFAHLKQFVYSFQETVLKRVGNEMAHGNYAPAMALAAYVPTMMAADAVKGMLLTGGGQPAYKDNWGFGDYLENAMERSSLFGVGQFGIDAYKNVEHGGTGLEALAGPTAEQAVDGLRVLGGREQFSKFAMDSLPLSAIDKAVSHTELSPDSIYAE